MCDASPRPSVAVYMYLSKRPLLCTLDSRVSYVGGMQLTLL
jgi:hypothetical protein